MTFHQQTPIFCDIARFYAYPVKQQNNLNFVQIATAGGSVFGSITLKPAHYFIAYGFTVFTNYDNVSPVTSTADSDATLGGVFVPNNFTVKINRGNSNIYSNLPMPQAQICAGGYYGGKVFPYPITYGPRCEFQFTFQDTTGLFLLDAVSEGEAVPLNIYMFMLGYQVPVSQWDKFCRLYPSFAAVFGAPPSL